MQRGIFFLVCWVIMVAASPIEAQVCDKLNEGLVLGCPRVVERQITTFECPTFDVRHNVRYYNGDDLYQSKQIYLMSGGNIDLSFCDAFAGHGYVGKNPNFSLYYTDDAEEYLLEIQGVGTCDTVLVINDPSGAWHFDDGGSDNIGFIFFDDAESGVYDVWVGSFYDEACETELNLETF